MNPLLTKAYLAGATVVQRRCVKFSASGTVILAAAGTDLLVGVSRGNQPDTLVGDRVDVQHDGIADCEAGAAFARGALLTSDGTGRVVAAIATNFVIGQALESAGAAGELVPVHLGKGFF